MTYSPRISGLLDSGFVVPDGAKELTVEGKPWVRWAKTGTDSGWYYVGTRPPVLPEPPSFWDVVFVLATETGSGRVDAVHCVGPGILSVGGTGITLASGYLAALLVECLLADPVNWVAKMAGVIRETGAFPTCMSAEVKDYADCCFMSVDGVLLRHVPLLDASQRSSMVRGDAYTKTGKWSGAGKRRAAVWVESLGKLLFEPVMDQAQVMFCKKHVPGMLSDVARDRISWPSNGADDAWQFTREQQALWVVAMVAGMWGYGMGDELAMECVVVEPTNARQSLLNMQRAARVRLCLRAEGPFGLRTFARRVLHAIKRVQEVYGFKLEDA